uniref:Uncharacterized protein n=1 Tax=Branchiostoma floridae TaxID=7739 RepID=C3YIC5_BRAFL|eukprot:XP_002604251.1 hypothetical protein BRAFLDRAFT_73399 [Branchiostoma floridae]
MEETLTRASLLFCTFIFLSVTSNSAETQFDVRDAVVSAGRTGVLRGVLAEVPKRRADRQRHLRQDTAEVSHSGSLRDICPDPRFDYGGTRSPGRLKGAQRYTGIKVINVV